jgi:hypothetical protein
MTTRKAIAIARVVVILVNTVVENLKHLLQISTILLHEHSKLIELEL